MKPHEHTSFPINIGKLVYRGPCCYVAMIEAHSQEYGLLQKANKTLRDLLLEYTGIIEELRLQLEELGVDQPEPKGSRSVPLVVLDNIHTVEDLDRTLPVKS